MRRTARFCLTLGMLCLLALSAACGGGGSSKSLSAQPSVTQPPLPQNTVSSISNVTPHARTTPPNDLILREKAFLTARGYYPDDPVTALAVGELGGTVYAYRSTCAVAVTVNHDNCQVVHFFLDETYLGTDTKYTYYGYEAVSSGQGHVTVDYTTYATEDPECCPTVKQTAVYLWNNKYELLSSREPPRPRGEPYEKNGTLASAVVPVYIAAYPTLCAPTSLTLPARQAIDIVFVNESGAPAGLRINSTELAGNFYSTNSVASGGHSELRTMFAENPQSLEFDCGSGKGQIRVVPSLPQPIIP